MTGPLDGPGTDEATWAASVALDALPVHDAAAIRPAGRVVVVAPHPDDEVLGVGGTLAVWAAAGTPVLVVAVTDGEGSHPDSPTLGRATLTERRRVERRAALGVLGLGPDPAVRRLGLPDGGVDAGAVEAALRPILDPTDVCLAPVEVDGHPDHDAAGLGARRAADAAGAHLATFAVWAWHWARPGRDDPLFRGARRIVLPPSALRAKVAAIACFTTQIAPLSADPRDAAVLPEAVRARFTRPFEVLWGPR